MNRPIKATFLACITTSCSSIYGDWKLVEYDEECEQFQGDYEWVGFCPEIEWTFNVNRDLVGTFDLQYAAEIRQYNDDGSIYETSHDSSEYSGDLTAEETENGYDISFDFMLGDKMECTKDASEMTCEVEDYYFYIDTNFVFVKD
jgi:hypothetical protein